MPDPAYREPFTAVLVAEPAMAAAPSEALALAGGRLLCRIGWSEVAENLGRQAGRPVILAETQGVPDALLAAMLPRIDAVVSALDLPVVVSLDAGAIDLVTASLFGPAVQPLVQPALADWVAALDASAVPWRNALAY